MNSPGLFLEMPSLASVVSPRLTARSLCVALMRVLAGSAGASRRFSGKSV